MSGTTQITTLTFFRYRGFLSKIWAFLMMQLAHSSLNGVEGMTFYKLMGSGKGLGFNPFPDWSVYALLQVWEREENASAFFSTSDLIKKYDRHCRERWTIYMRNISAHGQWSGQNPFLSDVPDPENPRIAVITRARIRTRSLLRFWRFVPTSEKPLSGNEGLIYTKGIGEVPVLNMATFSIWKDLSSLKAFAYQSQEHQEAIRKTRELGWYSEELFSRFQPIRTEGSWERVDLGLENTSEDGSKKGQRIKT